MFCMTLHYDNHYNFQMHCGPERLLFFSLYLLYVMNIHGDDCKFKPEPGLRCSLHLMVESNKL